MASTKQIELRRELLNKLGVEDTLYNFNRLSYEDAYEENAVLIKQLKAKEKAKCKTSTVKNKIDKRDCKKLIEKQVITKISGDIFF